MEAIKCIKCGSDMVNSEYNENTSHTVYTCEECGETFTEMGITYCDECGSQIIKDEEIEYDDMIFCSEECVSFYKKHNIEEKRISFQSVNKPLKISHYAQIPCKPFEFIIKYKENEKPIEIKAAEIIDIIARQHLFLGDNDIIPDFCNSIIVQIQDEDGDWIDYFNEKECADWDDMCRMYLNEILEKENNYQFLD